MKDDDLTQKIIGCAFKIHNKLGSGFLEKVYENALRIELEKLGYNVNSKSRSKLSMMAMSSVNTMLTYGSKAV